MGVDEILTWIFVMLQYFERILPLLNSLHVIYKLRQTLWIVALLGAYDVIQNGGQDDSHLGFNSKL